MCGCPISPHVRGRRVGGAIFFSAENKVVQNVNRISERQTDRKAERLFSLVIKAKVVQNVNRMSENIMSVCQHVSMSIC